jgi:hypothetical protein
MLNEFPKKMPFKKIPKKKVPELREVYKCQQLTIDIRIYRNSAYIGYIL